MPLKRLSWHVPADEIARQHGRYDEGWDVIRARRLERQKALGIVPQNTKLSERNPGVSAWDELDADERKVCARLQETYAAFLSHTDTQIGRLDDHLEHTGQLDNTVIVLL